MIKEAVVSISAILVVVILASVILVEIEDETGMVPAATTYTFTSNLSEGVDINFHSSDESTTNIYVEGT